MILLVDFSINVISVTKYFLKYLFHVIKRRGEHSFWREVLAPGTVCCSEPDPCLWQLGLRQSFDFTELNLFMTKLVELNNQSTLQTIK